MTLNFDIALGPSFKKAIGVGVCYQFVSCLLGVVAFDFGLMLSGSLVAMFLYWAMTAYIVYRRPQMPTKRDLILMRSSYVILLPLCIAVVYFCRLSRLCNP